MENNLTVKLYHSDGSFITEELAYKVLDTCWLNGSTIEIELPITKFDSEGWKDDLYLALNHELGRINKILYVTKLNP